MDKGLTHAYFGDGKGKTTAVIGLSVRAAGAGLRVLFQQFLKSNDSSELAVLKKIARITVGDAPAVLPFYFMMRDKEKQQYNRYADALLRGAEAAAPDYDLVVLDEILDCVSLGIIGEERLIAFIENKPSGTELALTGHSLGEAVGKRCDYISEVKAVKHPFEKGQAARKGVEF